MISELVVGAQQAADGSTIDQRAAKTGEAIVSQAHGKYYEAASRRKLFIAASQAATTWTIALAAIHTGLVVSNPLGSSVNLAIQRVGFGLSVAPAGVATVGLFGGYDGVTEVTHTTPLAVRGTYLLGVGGVANADGSATMPTAPVWLETYMGGFTAAALYATSPSIIDVDGAIIVPPGAYVGIGALTVVIGFGSIMWEEIPV